MKMVNTSWSLYTDTTESWASWQDAFSPLECEKIVEVGLSKQSIKATVGNEKELRNDVRKCQISFIPPEDSMHWVYQRLTSITLELNEKYFGFDLWGFAEGLQFTQYTAPGEKYDGHTDRMYKGVIRKLSIVLQLTDDTKYKDCDLEVYLDQEPSKTIRKQGTVIVFPSYTLHRVTPITKGVRHSLVGWISGKKFK